MLLDTVSNDFVTSDGLHAIFTESDDWIRPDEEGQTGSEEAQPNEHTTTLSRGTVGLDYLSSTPSVPSHSVRARKSHTGSHVLRGELAPTLRTPLSLSKRRCLCSSTAILPG